MSLSELLTMAAKIRQMVDVVGKITGNAQVLAELSAIKTATVDALADGKISLEEAVRVISELFDLVSAVIGATTNADA